MPGKDSDTIWKYLISKTEAEISEASLSFNAEEVSLLNKVRGIITDTASNEIKTGKMILDETDREKQHIGCLTHATNGTLSQYPNS